jgi:hypothetical protein
MTIDFDVVSNRDPEYVAAIRSHYTESGGAPVGKKLSLRIRDHGEHRGWIGLGEPSYKLAPRRRLGLEDARPLPLTVCCFIYKLDEPGPTSASDILKAWHRVVPRWWSILYGWEPIHFETMVDPSKIREKQNPGACFRRAGYRPLGMTTGRSARRPSGHSRGPRHWIDGTPKLVLYRGPLRRLVGSTATGTSGGV